MYIKLIQDEIANPEDHEAFTLLRRKGFGASDSATLLGISKWSTLDKLIAQKNSPEVTEEEIKVGLKPQVRMGNDLEPLVLKKFCEAMAIPEANCTKPEYQYYLETAPWLTINYDALWHVKDHDVPVELKTISMFATKYWDFEKMSPDHHGFTYGSATSLQDHVETCAKEYGIPPYYYTQVQQQLMGSTARYAYLAALCIKDWNLYIVKIKEDEYVQKAILAQSILAIEHIPQMKQRYALAD